MNEIYPKEKRKKDRIVHPYIYWVLRPLSFRLTYVLSRAKLSATACTAISGIVLGLGLLALIIAPWAEDYARLLGVSGALCANIYLYLDVVDGNLARLQKTTSRVGEFYDSTLNIFAGFSVPVAVSIYLYGLGGDALVSGEMFAHVMLAAGVGIAICRLFRRVISDNVDRLTENGDFSMVDDDIGVIRYAAVVVNSSLFPTLLVLLILDLTSLWLTGYFGFNLVVLVHVLLEGIRRVKKSY